MVAGTLILVILVVGRLEVVVLQICLLEVGSCSIAELVEVEGVSIVEWIGVAFSCFKPCGEGGFVSSSIENGTPGQVDLFVHSPHVDVEVEVVEGFSFPLMDLAQFGFVIEVGDSHLDIIGLQIVVAGDGSQVVEVEVVAVVGIQVVVEV